MTKKEKIVEKMQGLLAEVSDLNDESITDANYRGYYENAAKELDRYEEDEEDEDGESDIYKFTYNILDKYVDLKNELVGILKAEGLSEEQRKQFYQLNLCQEVN